MNSVIEILKKNIDSKINEVNLELEEVVNKLHATTDGEYDSLIGRAIELNKELYLLRRYTEKYEHNIGY